MTLVRRLVLTVLIGWSVAACSEPAGGGGPSQEPSGAESVMLSITHESRWRELRVEGATDLPDGAVLSYRVTHALANELPPSEWPAQNLIADGTAAVQEGKYGARLNTTYWPKGSVQVEVQFPIAPQPPTIRTRYGNFGEELTGNNVTVLGSSKVVTAEHTFNWTR